MGISFGFGHGLGFVQSVSGGAPPAAAISSLTIMGPTLIDATGDFGDATSRVGVNVNGWVAKATMPYLVGQTFDPSKISINLSDPGYSGAGTATTVSRTVRGGIILRRQYSAQASQQLSNDGVTFTVYFTLTADNAGFATVHQGTTLVSASAAAGYYGASAAGAISGLTNASTVTYPKPLFAWLQRQHTLVGSGGFYVEGVAYHAYGRNGRMVAGVQYVAKDSQATPNVSATQSVSSVALSTLVAKGQPPECYAATIPVSALTQGDLCFVNAKVYPWIGDSSAVLDLSVDGASNTGNWLTANPQTVLRFVNDKSGGYGAAHASVKAGASGGTVQAGETASRSTPFPTLAAALSAVVAWNNANKGHNDSGGAKIWLMDDGAGGAVQHTITSDPGNAAAGIALTEIRPSPSNTAGVSLYSNALYAQHNRISYHVNIKMDASGWFRGFGSAVAYFCDGTLDQSASSPAQAGYETLAVAYNLTQATSGCFDLTASEPGCQLIGYVNKVNTTDRATRAHVMIGCDLEHIAVDEIAAGTGSPSSQDGKIVANNKLMKLTNAGAGSQSIGSIGYAKGFAFVQNVVERAANAYPGIEGDDQSSGNAISNAIFAANSVVGDRSNLLYSNTAASQGVLKRGSLRFNLHYKRNTKDGVQGSLVSDTGCWKHLHDVDCYDTVMTGDSAGHTAPGVANWIGEYWNTPANCNIGLASFTNDASVTGSGLGGGDYHPKGSGGTIAKNKVPAGASPLAYFLDGAARANDGSDAAGALAWVA
jgi:hypothetical protein